MTCENLGIELFFSDTKSLTENRNIAFNDNYYTRKGYSPDGRYSLANRERTRLQMSCIMPHDEYIQMSENAFLWYEGDTIKKMIAYAPNTNGILAHYYEGDFHLRTNDRQTVTAVALRTAECSVCAQNLFGREIRGFFVRLNTNGCFEFQSHDAFLSLRSDVPPKIDNLWKFDKWLRKYFRSHPTLPFKEIPIPNELLKLSE